MAKYSYELTRKSETHHSKDVLGGAKEFGEERKNEQKARIVAKLRGQFQLRKILAAINFPKSIFMYWQKKWSEEDKDHALKDEILAIRREHKDYGYRRIHLELKNQGWAVNKKKVQRLSKHVEKRQLLRQRTHGKLL